jgi:uncharacterized membrane protein YheB (UPF0754 family)
MILTTFAEFLAEYWKIGTIPIIAALVGYVTNVIAVQMTFYPLELWGFRIGKIPIGWQGIIPSKSPKMAAISVDLMTSKLISIEDVILQLDPYEMADEMGPHMINMTEKVMSETLEEADMVLWESLPQSVKERIYARVTRELPRLIQDMMIDISENIYDLFDLKKMVIEALLRDKQLMVDIFLKCGAEEFKFIERSGLYFGFLFGLVQMGVWAGCSHYFPGQQWINLILPVFGGIVGYATNWVALKLIFRPMNPVKVLGMTFQGLFIKRQKEVSAEYARIVAGHIINSQNIYDEMIYGKHVDRLVKLVQVHVKKALDLSAGYTKPFIQFIVGPKKYMQVKKKLVKRFVYALPGPVRKTFDYTERAFDMENLLRTRLQALPPEEFEGILRPAFQEEELKLILVGMVLGIIAGTAQMVLIFGGNFREIFYFIGS